MAIASAIFHEHIPRFYLHPLRVTNTLNTWRQCTGSQINRVSWRHPTRKGIKVGVYEIFALCAIPAIRVDTQKVRYATCKPALLPATEGPIDSKITHSPILPFNPLR